MEIKQNCHKLEERIFDIKEKLTEEEFIEIEGVIKRIHNNEPHIRETADFVKLRVRSYNMMFFGLRESGSSIYDAARGAEEDLCDMGESDFENIKRIEEWSSYEDMYFKVNGDESDGISFDDKIIGGDVYKKIISRGYYSFNIGLNDNRYSIIILSLPNEEY